MNLKKKIFILLPDGVGLRNFVFSDFSKSGEENDCEVVLWNNTVFNLEELGLNEVKIKNANIHPLTDLLKVAKNHISLNLFAAKSKDKVYHSYKFPFKATNVKAKIKIAVIKILIRRFNSAAGLKKIEKLINKKERTTTYYKDCIQVLNEQQPKMVFCTNQRPITALAPLLAARDLGIPTASFIFSWDNLPKATMVVNTDYYFVWSAHMKKELLYYYPEINEKQIIITGTPQFESYFRQETELSKKDFFEANGLDLSKKYICYSGDDVTTCPDDAQYLDDVAQAVVTLNAKGSNLGIVFRRCPVDFSNRYDYVLDRYKDLIIPIAPKWVKEGEVWNTVLPTQDDVSLLTNTVAHTELVVNLGSSMVFDFVSKNKPCCFINYNVEKKVQSDWSVEKIYKFVHFRSMPDTKAVVWLNSKEAIANNIAEALENPTSVPYAKKWFEVVNQHPPQFASRRIWDSILKMI